jgi:hypothetical protein
MRIDKIFDLVGYILNKEQFTGKLKKADFNNVAEFVIYDAIRERYGIPEGAFKAGQVRDLSRETTRNMSDDLRHLKVWMGGKTMPMLTVDSDGRASFPTNYLHYSSIRHNRVYTHSGTQKIKEVEVEVLFDNELGDRLSNPNRTPSVKMPVCVLHNDYIQFYPKELGYVHFTYLRKPIPPVYATTTATLNGEDVETYSNILSTQLELPEDMHMDFIRLMCQHFAVHLRANDVAAYAQQQLQQR